MTNTRLCGTDPFPTSVSFKNVSFREDIPSQTWTWPNGFPDGQSATITYWGVGCDNAFTDTVSSSLNPINWLSNGSNYMSFGYSVQVPEEYQDDSGAWVSWFPGEIHPRQFRGSDQKASVLLDGVPGGWMGPWQSE
jgi:hypothetical protein